MPILPTSVSAFPDDLLCGFSVTDDLPATTVETPLLCGRRWWALYTKPQQEKRLAGQLLARKVPFYLPLLPKRNLIRAKVVHSYVPLFSGYVFLYADEQERVLALKTNRVVTVLSVPDPQQLYHDLRCVQQLIESGHALTIEKRLSPGQRVRVRRGPFAGLEGRILKRRRASRLIVAVNFLKQGASVAIDDFLVEPID